METGYQRGKIQDESMLYEHKKHSGELPIVGVNTFLDEEHPSADCRTPELARSTEEEKQSQIARVRAFQQRHATESGPMLERLQQTAAEGGNMFAELMQAVRCCSLGQVTHALFAAGGEYRRNV